MLLVRNEGNSLEFNEFRKALKYLPNHSFHTQQNKTASINI